LDILGAAVVSRLPDLNAKLRAEANPRLPFIAHFGRKKIYPQRVIEDQLPQRSFEYELQKLQSETGQKYGNRVVYNEG
jgi:hypothetical protein